jgi:hypothetical protein
MTWPEQRGWRQGSQHPGDYIAEVTVLKGQSNTDRVSVPEGLVKDDGPILYIL